VCGPGKVVSVIYLNDKKKACVLVWGL